jgi:hypothetical protein
LKRIKFDHLEEVKVVTRLKRICFKFDDSSDEVGSFLTKAFAARNNLKKKGLFSNDKQKINEKKE